MNPEIYKWDSNEDAISYEYSYKAAMPCLLNDKYLNSTIEALFNQEVKNIFYSIIIVISDAKKSELKKLKLDYIKKMHEKYNVSVKVFVFKERLNGSVARNLCFDNSETDFIGLCDSDDKWYPNKIVSEQVHLNEMKSKLGYYFFGSNLKIRSDKKKIINLSINIKHVLLSRKEFPHTSSWVLSKEIYKKIKFDNSLERYQDLAFILDVKKLFKKCLIINQKLVNVKKNMNRGKIKYQSLNFSLEFCKKYLNYNFLYSAIFILKYFFYPRVRYFFYR